MRRVSTKPKFSAPKIAAETEKDRGKRDRDSSIMEQLRPIYFHDHALVRKNNKKCTL